MRIVCGFLVALILLGCEKDIDIQLDPTAASLVVDATIENDLPPVVFLSNSLDYFGKIDPKVLSSSFIRNARVNISDGSSTVALTQDSIVNAGGTVVFYTTSGTSLFFRGKLNTSYTLTIETGGKSYTAKTTVPELTRQIDSLWWEKIPLAKDTNDVQIKLKGKDRPGLGDYIRYYTRVGKGAFLPGFNSVFDDQIIDGTSYTVSVDKGFDKNAEFSDSTAFFRKGDTVTVKICNIDKVTYDFWRTYEFSFQSIGNPFSSPTKILGNISNGALGYFGGYAAQYRSIIIPK
jgi:hypothetical protein